jgi:hypothetical protein
MVGHTADASSTAATTSTTPPLRSSWLRVDWAAVHRRLRLAGILLALVAITVAGVDAQFGRGRSFAGVRYATPEDFDGRFQYCRVVFRSDFRGDGGNWSVDFPRADINMSIRLSELTKTVVSFDAAGNPNHLLVRLTDPELFSCPFIQMTEVGSAFIDEQEAARLREYLLKGGFLWADDFWGSYAWEWWVAQLRKALPPAEYPIVELTSDHSLFTMLMTVKDVPQIPSIGHWARWGTTSERGADSATATARAIVDDRGNIMVLMTHNTDLGDSWEREADDPNYFINFSVPGYAFGINALLYALTH